MAPPAPGRPASGAGAGPSGRPPAAEEVFLILTDTSTDSSEYSSEDEPIHRGTRGGAGAGTSSPGSRGRANPAAPLPGRRGVGSPPVPPQRRRLPASLQPQIVNGDDDDDDDAVIFVSEHPPPPPAVASRMARAAAAVRAAARAAVPAALYGAGEGAGNAAAAPPSAKRARRASGGGGVGEPAASKCSICLDPIKNMACGPCGHVFCEPCLRAALSKNKKCPNCRKAMQPRQVHRVFV